MKIKKAKFFIFASIFIGCNMNDGKTETERKLALAGISTLIKANSDLSQTAISSFDRKITVKKKSSDQVRVYQIENPLRLNTKNTLAGKVFDSIAFGENEAIEVSYSPVRDESGKLISISDSSFVYRNEQGTRTELSSCLSDQNKSLHCLVSKNLEIALYNEQPDETSYSDLSRKKRDIFDKIYSLRMAVDCSLVGL